MNIGSRLKQILDERELNVSQLAREAEVSPQTLYAMIKRDSNKADMDIMARILDALDMDLLEFMGMEPKRKRKNTGKKLATKDTTAVAETTTLKDVVTTDTTSKNMVTEEISLPQNKETVPEPEVVVEKPRRREIADYLL